MSYANLLLNVLYHIVMEMKIRESCLQTGTFIYKPGISVTKQDFHLQMGSLGLQMGFSGYYLPRCIENGPDGKGFQRTRIYYCNPSAPYQKAEIEVGHEFIRRILPKGRSFDELTQADVELMMNHINSYRRKKLNGKSPYEAFSFYYGEDLAERLRCHEVAAKDINLTARLLKK